MIKYIVDKRIRQYFLSAMQDGSPQSNTVGQSGESRSIEDYNTEETEGVYQKDERHNLNANCLPTPKQCKVKIIFRFKFPNTYL